MTSTSVSLVPARTIFRLLKNISSLFQHYDADARERSRSDEVKDPIDPISDRSFAPQLSSSTVGSLALVLVRASIISAPPQWTKRLHAALEQSGITSSTAYINIQQNQGPDAGVGGLAEGEESGVAVSMECEPHEQGVGTEDRVSTKGGDQAQGKAEEEVVCTRTAAGLLLNLVASMDIRGAEDVGALIVIWCLTASARYGQCLASACALGIHSEDVSVVLESA